uniref:Cadherin domain-containing protein n=1 Tax=Gouania willdenowi TaxID=441366 RepID=A0A8C5ECQ4_GOUWI
MDGEGKEDISVAKDGWLFLEKPLDWSQDDHYVIVEALENDEVVEGPVYVTINVLDINNNAPSFNQSSYIAMVQENSRAGLPFTRVFASDLDDPQTPNAQLKYSLVSQIPNKKNVLLFQINPKTGEISTSDEGDMRRRNVDPLEDPDFTLLVRVQDLGGDSPTALSGNARVHIVVKQNLWNNPGPITIKENQKEQYPLVIAKVQSNDPDAVYTLVQKEKELKFPFQIKGNGEIVLTEELDREEKDMYILVVFAKDNHDRDVDPPMEIHILVEDVNDNAPECEQEESVFEVQEDEIVGTSIGDLMVSDADEEGTLNSQLTYTIVSQSPVTTPGTFLIDDTGKIQSLRMLQRKEHQAYDLIIRVSDSEFSTECKVVINVIDVNNETPQFEKNNYGSVTLAEDSPVGHTLVTIKATDADDPDSGSSLIEFHISGDEDEVFTVETDGKGVGHLVVAKPLDFEASQTYKLQIDARNPEPLMKGLEYGEESTAFVFVDVTDVDEVPEFSLDVLDVTVPENATKGSVLLTVEAKDPEGQEIRFKLDGDSKGWLEMDANTGQIRTKDKLDRETLETFEVTVTAFEKDHPEKSSERVVHVRLLDVNDNVPKLIENQDFICMNNPKPVTIKAQDADSEPFSQPFTFTFAHGKKSPNWDLRKVDGTQTFVKCHRDVSGADCKFAHAKININFSQHLATNHI